MLKFGSIIVPISAMMFLAVVIFLLVLLIVALMILNKLFCFANCKSPMLFFVDNSEKLLTDSESDDSDEDIFVNYSQIEQTAEADKLRSNTRLKVQRDQTGMDKHESDLTSETSKGSIKLEKSDKNIQEGMEHEELDDFKISSLNTKILKKHNKAAIVKTRLFLDTMNSKLKIQILQVFDIMGSENRVDLKRKGSIGKKVLELGYQIHCAILPLKKHRFQTKLKYGCDPTFNETFYVLNITADNIEGLSVRFRIYVCQASTLNIIGQCTFDLNTVDYLTDTEYNLSMDEPKDDDIISTDRISITGSEIQSAHSKSADSIDFGPEIMIGLALNSNTGRLTVEIIRGTTLSKDKNKDFYVKLTLFSSSGQEISHTKTSVRKNTISPVFRESFMFQVALFQMKEVTLMISVFAKKSIHRKEIIGWISFGYKSSGEEELSHWNEVKEGMKTEVIRSHRLHQNSNAKKFLH